MKDIIYLNEEFINSFISQVYDGLPIQKQNEIKQGNNEQGSNEETKTRSGEGGADVKLFSGKYQSSTTESNSLTTFESDETKEIVAKKIYDNALNDLESHLISKKQLKGNLDDLQFGDYVKISTELQLNDLRTFLDVVSNSTLKAYEFAIDDTLKEEKAKTNQLIEQLPQENKKVEKNKLNSQYSKLEKTKEAEKKDTEYSFKKMNIYISFLIDYLPTPIFIKTANTVIPIDEKYLWDSVKSVTFKYNNNRLENEAIILGKVTKKTDNVDVLDDSIIKKDELSSMYVSMNNVFNEFFELFNVLNKNEYVISPVAVYFEDDLI